MLLNVIFAVAAFGLGHFIAKAYYISMFEDELRGPEGQLMLPADVFSAFENEISQTPDGASCMRLKDILKEINGERKNESDQWFRDREQKERVERDYEIN